MTAFDLSDVPKDIDQKFFKTIDTYQQMDFMNDFKSKTWDTLD